METEAVLWPPAWLYYLMQRRVMAHPATRVAYKNLSVSKNGLNIAKDLEIIKFIENHR